MTEHQHWFYAFLLKSTLNVEIPPKGLITAAIVNQVIDELTSGSQTNERVITIVPGWTCEDIANYLVSIGALENTGEFLRLCNDVDRFVGSSYALRDAQNHSKAIL